MLRRVAELDFANQCTGTGWFKGSVERSLGVRVEIVANQNHLLAGRVTALQQVGHFNRPDHFRFELSSRRLTPARSYS